MAVNTKGVAYKFYVDSDCMADRQAVSDNHTEMLSPINLVNLMIIA